MHVCVSGCSKALWSRGPPNNGYGRTPSWSRGPPNNGYGRTPSWSRGLPNNGYGKMPFSFQGSSSTCYGTLAFCFLCFADSSAYPAPVSCGRYAYCVPCQIQHKYVNCCMKVATYAIVWESIDRQVLYGSRITAAACQLHVL